MKFVEKFFLSRNNKTITVPANVYDYVKNISEATVIYKDEVKRNWNFDEEISYFINHKIKWTIAMEFTNLMLLPREYVSKAKNVIVMQVIWGQNEEAYFYAVLCFIKYNKNTWVAVNSQKAGTHMTKIPEIADTTINYTDREGNEKNNKISGEKKIYFIFSE